MGPRAVALISDFGWASHFAGTMKSVILGIDPDARMVDITHDIPAQAVEEGAFILQAVVPFLPDGLVCVAVVDPGVGSDRRPIAIQNDKHIFVGPDNGVLSAALPNACRFGHSPPGTAGSVAVPGGCQAVLLSNARYFNSTISNTFHGRDIFAPVAAHAALGVPIGEFGEPIGELLAFPPWHAIRDQNGWLRGRVISVDSFGNLVTEIHETDLPDGVVSVVVGGREITGLSRSYEAGPEFIAYVGSSGYLEVGRRNSNAAKALRVSSGATVLVRDNESGDLNVWRHSP